METNLVETAKGLIGGSPENGTKASPIAKYSDLGSIQKHKYDYLLPLFGDQTIVLVPLIEGRGRNSWAKVNEKINVLEQAKFAEQSYHDALYDNFNIGDLYTSGEIMGTVGDVRRDCGLKPYASRLKINCENDFFGLFIVHEVTEDEVVDGKTKKKLIGYKPVFKLKPEE